MLCEKCMDFKEFYSQNYFNLVLVPQLLVSRDVLTAVPALASTTVHAHLVSTEKSAKKVLSFLDCSLIHV